MKEPFKTPLEIIKMLEQDGHEAYFVGGAVRDHLLKRQIGDLDIATSALPTQIMNLFSKTIDVGLEHGTVIVLYKGNQYEVTTFRSEEEYIDYRRPANVSFIDSLQEDLKRRDFTMNAIAMTSAGVLIDPFGGKEAIEKGVIESVGNPSDRFSEDALRMMRAVRFVSQLSFELSNLTKEAIKKHGHLLKHISVERITVEFEKLLKGPNSNHALELLIDTELYQYLPGAENSKEKLHILSNLAWSNLVAHEEYWSMFVFVLDLEDVHQFLRLWKLPNKLIQAVQKNVLGLKHVLTKGWTKEVLFENGEKHALQIERIRSIILDEDQDLNLLKLSKELKLLPISSRKELAVNGQDLLVWYEKEPGPWISEVLSEVERAVLYAKVKNDKLQIKEWLEQCNLK